MRERPGTTICLACGEQLSEDLKSVGAVRCQDCRDSRAPVRAEHLARQAESAGGTAARSAA